MAKKILLNIFYNLALIVLIFCLVWSIGHHFYMLSAAALFSAALIVFFKIRLIKEVKEPGKKRR